MKLISLLLVLFALGPIFSQDELFQVSPHWSIGDKRRVHTDVSTKVVYDDSLISNSRSVYDFDLIVLAVDDQYILNFYSIDKLPSVLTKSETKGQDIAAQVIRKLLEDAEIQFGASEMKVQVNKQTGVALGIKNGIEITKKVDYDAGIKLKEWCKKSNTNDRDFRLMKIELSKQIEEIYPPIKQIVLDKLTTIFSAYNVAFPVNSTFTQNVKTRDVTAASKSDTLFPAVMTMETVEVNDKMVVKTSLDYDKKFLLEQLKKSYDKLEGVESTQVSIIEKEEIVFDLNTTWIQKHTTNLHFEIPGMKTITKSNVTFL